MNANDILIRGTASSLVYFVEELRKEIGSQKGVAEGCDFCLSHLIVGETIGDIFRKIEVALVIMCKQKFPDNGCAECDYCRGFKKAVFCILKRMADALFISE